MYALKSTKLLFSTKRSFGTRAMIDTSKDPWIPLHKERGASYRSAGTWTLAPYRNKGDDMVDYYVNKILKNNEQIWYSRFMGLQLNNGEPPPENFPPYLKEYWSQFKMPHFADKEKMARASQLFQEIDDFIHHWNVIASLSGVHPDLIPEDAEDAFGLLRVIQRIGATPEVGKQLTDALAKYLKDVTPETIGDGAHDSMMRYLLGDTLADYVGVPKDLDWTRHLIPVVEKVFLFC